MAPLRLAVAFALVSAGAAGAANFTVHSLPVELRFGEVYNKVQFDVNALRLPSDVIARYADGEKLMAISGWDVDVVRVDANGGESRVRLDDHYLHHYIFHFGEAKELSRMLEPATRDWQAANMFTGCHAMKGAGVRQFQNQLVEEGKDYRFVAFGGAAGAEYRQSPQRFPAPYRLLLRKPEVWATTLHLINTNSGDSLLRAGNASEDVSPLIECPCTPQRKIDIATGTIDGKAVRYPLHCSEVFAATGNPSCHLSTYVGGLRCCEDGVFLIDTDKYCKSPTCAEERVDNVLMKFTVYYEDAQPETRNMEPASCCDVTSDRQDDGNIEYDVPRCAEGTPPDSCIHVVESVQPLGYYGNWDRHAGSDLIDLVFAAPHLHRAGISLELIDHATNATICAVHRTPDNSAGVLYGHGSTAGDESGYLVGLTPCSWGGGTPPRFRRDHPMRTRAVYNATQRHTGVMSLWLGTVSAVADSELLV